MVYQHTIAMFKYTYRLSYDFLTTNSLTILYAAPVHPKPEEALNYIMLVGPTTLESVQRKPEAKCHSKLLIGTCDIKHEDIF
jgi:hypothetical protein